MGFLVIGGLLSDPVKSYPALFGAGSTFDGIVGVRWLQEYPFALPMLLNFFFMVSCATLVAFFLEEVSSPHLATRIKAHYVDWTGRP
jgi:hypothetical protein